MQPERAVASRGEAVFSATVSAARQALLPFATAPAMLRAEAPPLPRRKRARRPDQEETRVQPQQLLGSPLERGCLRLAEEAVTKRGCGGGPRGTAARVAQPAPFPPRGAAGAADAMLTKSAAAGRACKPWRRPSGSSKGGRPALRLREAAASECGWGGGDKGNSRSSFARFFLCTCPRAWSSPPSLKTALFTFC